MMDLEPLPPLTAAKPASPAAAASSPRYFTGAAAHEVRRYRVDAVLQATMFANGLDARSHLARAQLSIYPY